MDSRLGRHRSPRRSNASSRRCPGSAAILDRKGGALSGGEQQILALGRALIAVPWLLLLDEPSEGIQPSIVQEIGEILVGLRKRDKLSLVVVEQNLDLVLDVADRIVVVERGRIEREVDAHTAQAGGIAELLGMGKMRTTRSAPARAAASAPTPAARAAAPSRTTSMAAPRPAPPLPAAVARTRLRPPAPLLRRPRVRPFPEVNPCRWSSAPRSSR